MIRLEGEEVKRVKTFKYLGSTLAEDEELDAEVNHRVQCGWRNWKKVSGVRWCRRMKVKLNGNVYKTLVRPAMVYGADTWAVKKAHEKKMEVAEMKILRWMCGVTRLDKIRNDKIRESTKVGEISKKVQERRMRWYGHVIRGVRRKEGDWYRSARKQKDRKTEEAMGRLCERRYEREGTVRRVGVRPVT